MQGEDKKNKKQPSCKIQQKANHHNSPPQNKSEDPKQGIHQMVLPKDTSLKH